MRTIESKSATVPALKFKGIRIYILNAFYIAQAVLTDKSKQNLKTYLCPLFLSILLMSLPFYHTNLSSDHGTAKEGSGAESFYRWRIFLEKMSRSLIFLWYFVFCSQCIAPCISILWRPPRESPDIKKMADLQGVISESIGEFGLAQFVMVFSLRGGGAILAWGMIMMSYAGITPDWWSFPNERNVTGRNWNTIVLLSLFPNTKYW